MASPHGKKHGFKKNGKKKKKNFKRTPITSSNGHGLTRTRKVVSLNVQALNKKSALKR